MNPQVMKIPTEFDMLESLGVEPIESESSEGYFAYEWHEGALTLRLSWHALERSVQAAITVANRKVLSVCQEGGVAVWIEVGDGPQLFAEFQQGEAIGRLRCRVSPFIEVVWSVLNP